MSIYNIREKFSYVLPTSSIDYIRNYNFNSVTVTDIPLTLANSDTEIPITVNITASVPWINFVNPTTGANLRYPNGNVVLPPTGSAVVLVNIDLPPEIESIPSSSLYPDIILDIKSGSFPIILPPGDTAPPTNVIVPESDIYIVNIGGTVDVNIAVYDINGNQDTSATVVWTSNNTSIVQIEEPQNIQVGYAPYTPRTVRGISPGETTVTISAGEERTASITVTVIPGNVS